MRVAVLGSTGSIGRQTLDVLGRDPRFDVVGLAAGRNAGLFGEQLVQFRPSVAVLADDDARRGLAFVPPGTSVECGQAALEALASRPNLITMPQFLIGGTFFSTDNFPSWLKAIADVLPLKHLNDAMRNVAFEGAHLNDCLKQIGILGLWGVAVYIVAIKVFRWE